MMEVIILGVQNKQTERKWKLISGTLWSCLVCGSSRSGTTPDNSHTLHRQQSSVPTSIPKVFYGNNETVRGSTVVFAAMIAINKLDVIFIAELKSLLLCFRGPRVRPPRRGGSVGPEPHSFGNTNLMWWRKLPTHSSVLDFFGQLVSRALSFALLDIMDLAGNWPTIDASGDWIYIYWYYIKWSPKDTGDLATM